MVTLAMYAFNFVHPGAAFIAVTKAKSETDSERTFSEDIPMERAPKNV